MVGFASEQSRLTRTLTSPDSAKRCWLGVICISLCWLSFPVMAGDRAADLTAAIRAVDASTPGTLGLYIKRLDSGAEFGYQAARKWYLASLVKVPLAVAVLQAVEDKQLALQDSLVLQEADFVDGSGDMLFEKPGTRHSIANLLEQSLEHSDSTATDMLMRRLGVEEFNQRIRKSIVKEDLGPFTTILQVRYDAYGELHANAQKLSNMDYVEIRSADDYDARVAVFQRKLKLAAKDLATTDLEEAFDRYYQRDLNKGTLPAVGQLLERLVRGELLNKDHTALLLDHMEKVTTGDKRLEAGLPDAIPFAQKTGTQINRACNIGVTYPRRLEQAMVIVACAEDFGEIETAEAIFKKVAEAVVKEGWLKQ